MTIAPTRKDIPLLGYKMVPFNVIREPIYKYKFSDGGVLYSKFTLIMVFFEKDPEEMLKDQKDSSVPLSTRINMKHHVTMGIDCPDNLKGIPNQIKGENLKERVVEEDIDIIEPHEPFFEYQLDNGFRIKGKMVLMNVDRTDRFNENGLSVYIFDYTIDMKIIPPKKLKKKSKRKKER